MSYDDCVRQATQIADPGACQAACFKAGRATSDCQRMCNLPMAVIPWYAAGAGCGGGRCRAPAVEAVFAGARAMGLQPTVTQVRRQDLEMTKIESPGNAVTSDSGSWSEEAARTMVTQHNGARREQPLTTVTGQMLDKGGGL